MKQLLIYLSFLQIVVICNIYSQINLENPKKEITEKEWVQLKLDILSVKLSSGIYIIPDMIWLNKPIKINLDENKYVHITIYLENKETIETLNEDIVYIRTAIMQMFQDDFPQLKIDYQNDIYCEWIIRYSPNIFAVYEKGSVKLKKE